MSIQPGDRLKEEIERLGVSALARELGVARNTLYNWAEKQNIPLEQLFAIAKAGADLSYILLGQRMDLRRGLDRLKLSSEMAALLGGKDPAANQARIFEFLGAVEERTADEQALLTDYRQCDAVDQDVIRKMARSLAKPAPAENAESKKGGAKK